MENKIKYEIIAHEVIEHIYVVEAEDVEEAIDMVQEEEVQSAHQEPIMKMIDEVKEIKYV